MVNEALNYLQRKNYSDAAIGTALTVMDQIDGTSSGNANLDKANNRLAENFNQSIVMPNEFASHNQFVEGRAIERENLSVAFAASLFPQYGNSSMLHAR
jgi:hypothetical protein